MAHGTIKREQIDTEGAGNIATDMEVAQMVSSSFVNPGHNGLSGLENDDHTQYLLTNGSRGVSGSIDVRNNLNIIQGNLVLPVVPVLDFGVKQGTLVLYAPMFGSTIYIAVYWSGWKKVKLE